MRKTVATLILTGLISVAAIANTPTATADTQRSVTDSIKAYMKSEGGDLRHCVTGREFNRVPNGSTKKTVRRIFDTRGQRVSGHTMDAATKAMLQMLGLTRNEIEHAPRRHREIRRYEGCVVQGQAWTIFVEFDTRTHRWTQMLSQ